MILVTNKYHLWRKSHLIFNRRKWPTFNVLWPNLNNYSVNKNSSASFVKLFLLEFASNSMSVGQGMKLLNRVRRKYIWRVSPTKYFSRRYSFRFSCIFSTQLDNDRTTRHVFEKLQTPWIMFVVITQTIAPFVMQLPLAHNWHFRYRFSTSVEWKAYGSTIREEGT